jgi:glutamate-1-semialdehyde 2,1-aminomutase
VQAELNGPMPQVGTLNGNPIAAAAGLATLKVLRQEEGIYERLFATGRQIKNALDRLLNQAEIPAQVIGHDSLFDVYFTDDEITDYRGTVKADKKKLMRLNLLLRDRGVFKGDTKYYISTAHTNEDVDLAIGALESAIEEL